MQKLASWSPTTVVERSLLMALLMLLPLEDNIPVVGGFSILFLVFGVVASYVFLNRFRAMRRILFHPVFLTSYVFLFVSFLMESMHLNPNYGDLFRLGLMIAGAVLIASLCRDKVALRTSIYACIGAGIVLSSFLFLTTYGSLSAATATSYQEASQVREKVLGDVSIGGEDINPNKAALYTALGTVAALALMLAARSLLRRALFLGIALFSLVATFLPMSRGGIVTVLVGCGVVMVTHRAHRIRTLAMALVLGIGIASWVPEAVYSRMDISTGGRAQVYEAALEHLSDYLLTGVGFSDFWGTWGEQNGFASHSKLGITGAHNIFLQITIYWGLLSLLALLALIWQASRCLPGRCGDDALPLCLRGIATGVLLSTLFVQTFYDKHFSLALGLLVGAHCWIWPASAVRSAKRQHSRGHPTLVHAS